MFNLFDMFAEMYRRFCTWDYINTGGYQFWSKTNPYYLAGQSFSRSTRDALHFPNFLIPLFYSSTFSTLQKNPSHPPTCLPFQQALERIPFWFSFWLTLLTQKINPIGSICGIYLPIFFTNKKLNHSHLSKYNIPSIHSSSPKMNYFFVKEQLLRRAITHCNWGVSDTKVLGLLTSRPCHSAKLVLSPTVTTLRQAVCQFSSNKLQVDSVGGKGWLEIYRENCSFWGKNAFLFFWGGHVFNSLHKRGNILMNETIWCVSKNRNPQNGWWK